MTERIYKWERERKVSTLITEHFKVTLKDCSTDIMNIVYVEIKFAFEYEWRLIYDSVRYQSIDKTKREMEKLIGKYKIKVTKNINLEKE